MNWSAIHFAIYREMCTSEWQRLNFQTKLLKFQNEKKVLFTVWSGSMRIFNRRCHVEISLNNYFIRHVKINRSVRYVLLTVFFCYAWQFVAKILHENKTKVTMTLKAYIYMILLYCCHIHSMFVFFHVFVMNSLRRGFRNVFRNFMHTLLTKGCS